jgi:hypothetical protein
MEGGAEMNMQTPEADKLHEQRGEIHSAYFMMLSHARQLERERNDLHESLVKCSKVNFEQARELNAERALADRLVAFANTIIDALGPYPDLNGHKIVWDACNEIAAWKESRKL